MTRKLMTIAKRFLLSYLPLLLLSTAGFAADVQRARIAPDYGRLPLAFEANQGQIDRQVKFFSRGAGYSVFLTPTGAVLTLCDPSGSGPSSSRTELLLPRNGKFAAIHLDLVGANPAANLSGEDELGGKSNYFIGNDPTKWQTNVRQYSRVRYANIYRGVDVIYYGNQRELEYDFVIRAGNDPGVIRLGIAGASKVQLHNGDLVMSSTIGDIHLLRPRIYQEVNGTKREIRGSYFMRSGNEVGFRVGAYDKTKTLIIDPVLSYSTYLGGSGDDRAIAITVDAAGNAYVTGWTTSYDFPTANPIQRENHGGERDAFISKISSDGSALLYSTYLGGGSDESGQSIALDSTGNVYLTGYTGSADFPTVNPFQPTLHGWRNAFVAKINADGNALMYSTYLGGGEDYGWGIAVDAAGRAHVRGDTRSHSFPVLNAIQPTLRSRYYFNCFVSEFNPAGDGLVYSTYWGGTGNEGGTGLALDSDGNTYIGGSTSSADFPTVNPIQPNLKGGYDAFVTKFSADGQAVVYSTYLGGSADESTLGSTIDSSGNAYIAGYTDSSDFPTVNAIQSTNGGAIDAFVAKINAAGSALVYSTYLGGSADDRGSGITADMAGNAYVVGYTSSTNFPMMDGIQNSKHGGRDAFVTKLSADGRTFLYSTYLGGSSNEGESPSSNICYVNVATDSASNAYVIGLTYSNDFPVTPGTFQQSLNGVTDTFVAKIALVDTRAGTTTDLSSALNPSTYGQAVTFTAQVTSDLGTPTGTVQILNGSTVVGTGTLVNGSASIPVSKLATGADSIIASYLGSSGFAPSKSSVLIQTVTRATTTTSVTSSLNPAATNQPVTFTAIVSGQFGGAVTGSVIFYSGSQTLGTASLNGTTASLTTSFSAAGTYSISAKYNGDVNNTGSTSSTLRQVIIASTTTTLVSSLNPSVVGQAVTFTSAVSSSAGAPPNGETITFKNGSVVLGTAPLSGGMASLTTSSLAAGIYTITASYPGDANFAASTSPGLRQVVNSTTKSVTQTTLVSSLNPSVYGQKVTWTATVTTSGSVPPTGKVNFTWGYNIGTVTLNASGVAALTRSNLNADPYPLKAVYVGDLSNLGSTSSVLNQLITQATTSAALTSSPNPSSSGQAVTFTATITSPTVQPTGPVTFAVGKTVLGTAQLSGGKAKFAISTLAVGSTKVTATYYGNSNIAKSSALVTQTVH